MGAKSFFGTTCRGAVLGLILFLIGFLPSSVGFGQGIGREGSVEDLSPERGFITGRSGVQDDMIDAASETTISDEASAPNNAEEPVPGDVLNPDKRVNTPNLKIALKAGVNRSSYSNDRFPDNRPFDIGSVTGETDVYGSGAGWGYQFGVEVEIPRNTFFSWTLGLRYDHVNFGNNGVVTFPCYSAEGDSIGATSFHDFDANIDYLKLSGAAKLSLQRFYFLLGLTGETPLSNSLEFRRELNGTPCYYLDANDMRNTQGPTSFPEIGRVHFSLRLGAGIAWDLTESIQFSPELILDFGFDAINKSPESDLGVYALNGVLRVEL